MRAVLGEQGDAGRALSLVDQVQRMAKDGLYETRRAVHALRADNAAALDEQLAALIDTHRIHQHASARDVVSGARAPVASSRKTPKVTEVLPLLYLHGPSEVLKTPPAACGSPRRSCRVVGSVPAEFMEAVGVSGDRRPTRRFRAGCAPVMVRFGRGLARSSERYRYLPVRRRAELFVLASAFSVVPLGAAGRRVVVRAVPLFAV